MRLWRIGGVLFLIGAEALLYGYSYPFFSLALEKRELSHWLIGFNASLAGVGILFVGPFLPRAIDRLGINRLVALLFAVAAASFVAILTIGDVTVWFASRFVMGTCFSALWTTTEIWLNGAVDDRSRGRIIGASSTLYAVCQFIAPMLLGATGVTGSLPLIVAIVPLAIAAVIALAVPGSVSDHDREPHPSASGGLKAAFGAASLVIVAAFLSGVGETAMHSLLPLYGLAHGFDDVGAARLVAMFSLGEASLVLALGWMADRLGRGFTLKAAALVATATMVLLPMTIGRPVLLVPTLFFAGGTIAGIYALGVILIGHDFRGRQLAIVSTGFGMSYSLGSIVGATPVGLLIDIFGPEALPLAIAAGFLGLSVYLVLRTRIDAVSSDAAGLPEFEFDFRLTDPAEVEFDFALAGPATGRPDSIDRMRGCERQENELHGWFRQRAAELAERAADRDGDADISAILARLGARPAS
jgi:MFS family permease